MLNSAVTLAVFISTRFYGTLQAGVLHVQPG
jgi:hypothetical protein